jgi:putative PIN family toxin of toxin-antitoxin system
MLRLVIDTQVWIDWLVFDDSSTWPLKTAVAEGRAEVFIDYHCHAELERVLDYPLGKRKVAIDEQFVLADACLNVSTLVTEELSAVKKKALPRCADRDDQKFLELAAAAGADYLVTRDKELLVLARRVSAFRIVSPTELNVQLREKTG